MNRRAIAVAALLLCSMSLLAGETRSGGVRTQQGTEPVGLAAAVGDARQGTSSGLAPRDNRSQLLSGGDEASPASWERVVGGAYENRGVAQIARLGDRWVLNVMCAGTHATYIDDTKIDLRSYTKGYVSARYHYIDRTIRNQKCFRAPCSPVRERRIALEHIAIVNATATQARELANGCHKSGSQGDR